MTKIIEEHHISYKPEIVKKTPRKEHQEIHGIVPNATALSIKMRQYDEITKLIVMKQNWLRFHEADFGVVPDIGLEYSLKLKKNILEDVEEMIKEELKKVKHIKGVGVRYLAGILAYAHPNRFPSLRKFLFYCGYTEASNKLKKYSRRIKPIINQAVKNLIMHKDKKYYSLYLKFKQDLGNHYKAINRVGTYLLKEIYLIFNAESGEV